MFCVLPNASVIPQMAAVGYWRLPWARWSAGEESAEVTNGLHQNALSSPVKERDCEVEGCLGSQGWQCITLLLFSTSGVMQLFSEGSWQPIICSAGRSNLRISTVDWENGGGRVTAWQSNQNQGRRHSWLWLDLDRRFWNQLIILSISEGIWQDGGHQSLFSLKWSEVLEHLRMLSWFLMTVWAYGRWIFWGLNRVGDDRSGFLVSRVFTSFKLPAAQLFSQRPSSSKEPKLLWFNASHRSSKTLIMIY